MRIKSLLTEDEFADKLFALHAQQIFGSIDDVNAKIINTPHAFAIAKCMLEVTFDHHDVSLVIHGIDDQRPTADNRYKFIVSYTKSKDPMFRTFTVDSLEDEEGVIEHADNAFNSIIGELEQQRLNSVAAAFSKEHQISYLDYDICKKRNVGPVLPYGAFNASSIRIGKAVRDGKKVSSVIILKPSDSRDPEALGLFHNAINDFNDQVLRKHKASLLLSEIDHMGKRFVYAI